MFRCSRWSLTATLLGTLLVPAIPAMAADRPAPEILKELDAMRMPPFDQSRQAEPGYVDALRKQFQEIMTRRDGLILELFHSDSDNPRLPELMTERWRRMPPIGPNADKLEKEVDQVLARTHNEKLKSEAFFARAQIDLVKSEQSGRPQLTSVDDFVKKHPSDQRSEQLLYFAALVTKDAALKHKYEERVLTEYPRSNVAAVILGARRQAEGIGKPFELEFKDAISGRPVSMKDLKGKVVVVDFWATWCGPCVASLPHLKELYEKYHPQGMEIIGVSLDAPTDQGGLEKLKSFVQAQQIKWPQYYMGNGWESEFSKSWGINAIPAMFIVDKEGKLASTQARSTLDQLIPELLGKKGNSRGE